MSNHALLAQPADAPGPGTDRRVWVRYPCTNLDTFCQPISAATGLSWMARVRDISAGGIGLLVSRRFEPRTTLAIELQSAVPGQSHTLLARVVYVRPHPEVGWSIGCAFTKPISEEELQALLDLDGKASGSATRSDSPAFPEKH